jgi:hypothetical protein
MVLEDLKGNTDDSLSIHEENLAHQQTIVEDDNVGCFMAASGCVPLGDVPHGAGGGLAADAVVGDGAPAACRLQEAPAHRRLY